ncbi:Putative phage protein, Chromosome segregation ATPase [Magnetospirillum sp. XM-1]|uniref:DUF4041 domain-containing protein n=1 Tax=Magnetospirillum sp. XM-1 TaxID=1663591 RepID=UPI00073DD783|nr:DUF4041 domain-containing protein [Magnetospirillum sp. XM-1]CUW37786.1 Putative phage protein, Chromosome segregation ATPase [Magnetospirillum sp. XM-1]
MELTLLAALSAALIAITLGVILFKTREMLSASNRQVDAISSELKLLKDRIAPLNSIEAEVARLSNEESEIRSSIDAVRSTYSEKRQLLGRLIDEVAAYSWNVRQINQGFYEPKFKFNDSESFKKEILAIRERQKLEAANLPSTCAFEWYVGDSQSKGRTLVKRQSDLSMRAFNLECDSAIESVRGDNVATIEKRILSAAERINKANEPVGLEIDESYVELKLQELYLTHEYRERLKAEKEERAEKLRAEREEKRLLEEAAAAEEKEREYLSLLEQARSETGVDQKRIAELEALLADARMASERARSMAEMTKSGYVYIISNIGSFGEDIVKIGLTRRLDPDDRVRELGDASVPFTFDTHAMIYSDDAPALESALHREFSDRRVNMANLRKEFFRVKLDEVEEAVARLAPDANFFKDRDAEEWHETLLRRREEIAALDARTELNLPNEI